MNSMTEKCTNPAASDLVADTMNHAQLQAWGRQPAPSAPTGTRELGWEAEDREREGFEAQMRAEGVTDFTRRPSGRYEHMVLEWHWLGWRARAKVGAA